MPLDWVFLDAKVGSWDCILVLGFTLDFLYKIRYNSHIVYKLKHTFESDFRAERKKIAFANSVESAKAIV